MAAMAMLFAQKEHHDSQRGATPQVLKQQQAQAWLPDLPELRGLPGLQEYLPPCWLSCLTGPEDLKDLKVPMVQQIWAASNREPLDDHHLGVGWPRANPDIQGTKDETGKGISSFLNPQKIQTSLSLASLELPLLEGPPPGFPVKVKAAWSCPCPCTSPWGLAEDCGTKKGEDRRIWDQETPEARSCPFPVPNQVQAKAKAKAKAAGMSVALTQPLPTGPVVRDHWPHLFPEVVTGESTSSETTVKLSLEKTEEIIKSATKVLSDGDDLIKGKAQASPRTESTTTPRELPKKTWKNKRAKKRGHDSGPKNSVVEYVFQPDHHLLEEFELVPKGIDRGGKNTKGIAARCNGKVRFRGMGSNYFEHKHREAPIPLRLCISCPPENFEEGQEEAKKLLAELQKDFVTKCCEHKKWPRPGCKTLYTEHIRAENVWIRTDGPPFDWHSRALER